MKQKRHSMDQIISKLRKADVELGKGKKVPEVCKDLEVAEQTYYRWRQKYGGMQPEMVKQLKALEKENSTARTIGYHTQAVRRATFTALTVSGDAVKIRIDAKDAVLAHRTPLPFKLVGRRDLQGIALWALGNRRP